MAIPVLQSVNTTGWQTSTSTDVTKPSGLAVGDLLIAYCASEQGQTGLPSGFSTIGSELDGQIDSGRFGSIVGCKIADSSDVAATNFTFTGSYVLNYCSVSRITGASTVQVSYKYAGGGLANTSTPTYAGLTPTNYGDGTLLMMFMFGRNNVSGISSYAIATSNPSWTQRYASASGGNTAAMASASRTQVTATGNFSAAGGDPNSDWTGHLISIPQPNAFSVTESITLSESYIKSISVRITETVSTFSRFITSIMRWQNTGKSNAMNATNANKNTTSFANIGKSAAGTITNATKHD